MGMLGPLDTNLVLKHTGQVTEQIGRLRQQQAQNTLGALSLGAQSARGNRAVAVQEGLLDLSQQRLAGEQQGQLQKQEFEQRLKQAAQGGLPAIKEFFTSQGMVDQVQKMEKHEAEIDKLGFESDKMFRDSEATIQARGAAEAFQAILAVPPGSQQAVYNNVREGLAEQGIDLPQELTPDVMTVLAAKAASVDKLAAQLVGNKESMVAFGGALSEVLGAKGQQKSQSFTQALVSGHQKAADAKGTSDLEKLFGLQDRLDSQISQETDPDRRAQLEARRDQVGLAVKKKSSGKGGITVNVDTGKLDPSTKTQNDLQKTILDGRTVLADLDRIAESFDPEVLTIVGKAKTNAAIFGDKSGLSKLLGVEDVSDDLIARAENFLPEVERFFAEDVKRISGGAVAVEEFDRLKKAFLNGELSPKQFEIRLSNLMERTRALVNRSLDAATQGIDTTRETAQPSKQEQLNKNLNFFKPLRIN